MWFDLPATQPDWGPALRHLRRADPVMKSLIARVGPCTLVPRPDPYIALCQSIFSQQISTTVAAVLFARFREYFPAKRPTPNRVLKLIESDPTALKRCGLSGQKQAYIADLSLHFSKKLIPVQSFATMPDEAIIQSLLPVKGVGRWTGEMFLIFVLNRHDLFPVDDLGLRKGIQIFYDLPELPSKKEIIPYGDRWKPYRSIATWYLWRGQDPSFKPKKNPA